MLVKKMFLPPPPVTIAKIEKRNLSSNDEILKLRLEQSAKVLAEVLKDKSIASELSGQVARKLKITGNNESLTFRELFQEAEGRKTQSSGLQNPKVFTMDAAVANHFKTKYLEVLKTKNYEHPEKYAVLEKVNDISSNVYNDGTTCFDCLIDLPPGTEIYFPYSENYLNPNLTVNPNLNYTVISHPINNDAVNEGVVWNSITQTWDYVLVDDNYAWDRPTFIITIDEVSGENNYRPTPLESTPNNTGRQVFVGQLMSTEQYGELFTGGPRFMFKVFHPGSLTAPFSVDNDFKQFKDGAQSFECRLTRTNVRKQQWVKFDYIAHSNWVPNHEKIHIGLFEDDSPDWFANDVIKFNPKVKWKDKEFSLFEIEIKGNGNDYIGEYDQDRLSFFALNNGGSYPITTRQSPSGPLRIYKLGAVNWTMPVVNF
jgi:hypothetical protein